MLKEDRRKLKNLSRYKWTNPNSFNALSASIAFFTIVVLFALIQWVAIPAVSPFLKQHLTPMALQCILGIITQFIVLGVAWVFCKIKHVKFFGGSIRLRFDLKICLPALLLSIGTFLFISPLHQLFASYLGTLNGAESTFASAIAETEVFDLTDIGWALFYILIVVPIFPAICEEALFRGVILNGLKQYGIFFSVFASGLAFALMHGNYQQLILQFICGCEIAYVVLVTNNYFAGIIMHFANNSFSIIYALIIGFAKPFPHADAFVNATFILCGLIMICLAVIYYYKLEKFKKRTKEEGRQGYKYLFYTKTVAKHPCCLLQKGCDIDCCFTVNEERVLNSDNSNFLFFGGRRFHSFTKNSGKVLAKVFFITAAVICSVEIVLKFFLVG